MVAVMHALFLLNNTYGQLNIESPYPPPKISVTHTDSKITVDGRLDEAVWSAPEPVHSFRQVEPMQGSNAVLDTEVKLLSDNNYLYIGAFAKDPDFRKNLRVTALTRDFSFDENDLFGVAIDAFNTKRNSVAFQVTPYGTQRDLQSFDDAVIDTDWDAVWFAKTLMTDSGWYVEMAIPFQSLRYSPKIKEWGINFIRISRASNEISAFPGYPRSFDTYRMTYAATLLNLELPRPGINLRINPYLVMQANQLNSSYTGNNHSIPKLGGDVKWAVTQHSAIDATFNTDFAQADVDRQVINLTRFSVYFPERRQFFLENSGLFLAGDGVNIEPFFSRSIGLDSNGSAVPLIFGTKFTDRTARRNIGAIYTLQKGGEGMPNMSSAVLSASFNYGHANSIGAMVTNRFSSSANNNTVASVHGLMRIGQAWSIKYMGSKSFDRSDNAYKNGTGASLNIDYTSNKMYFSVNHVLISENYLPALGFVSRGNLFSQNVSLIPVFRPIRKNRFIRSIQPGIIAGLAERASDWYIQEGAISIFPLYLVFNNGGLLSFRYQYNLQRLADDFYVYGTGISRGNYYYSRYRFKYNSDLSKKFSVSGVLEEGGYFNGRLKTYSAEMKIVPVSKISLAASYEFNRLINVGNHAGAIDTRLFTSTLRLALNANLQLTSFYQYLSAGGESRINIRLSWQFKPLSYVYFVFNSSNNSVASIKEQQGVFKINFLKQIK